MRLACWIPKATNIHSEYVILIVFSRHKMVTQRSHNITFIRTLSVLIMVHTVYRLINTLRKCLFEQQLVTLCCIELCKTFCYLYTRIIMCSLLAFISSRQNGQLFFHYSFYVPDGSVGRLQRLSCGLYDKGKPRSFTGRSREIFLLGGEKKE